MSNKFCYLFAFLFLALLQPAIGQKIREKKDVIYVNDVPLYKFIRTKGGIGKPEQEHVIMTLENDTLIWFKYVKIKLRKQEHEKFVSNLDSWELRFKGTEEVVPYKLPGSFYHDLIKLGVLKDGQLDMSALPTFKSEIEPDLKYIRMMIDANEHRKKLELMPQYADYCKRLVKRDGSDLLYIDGGKVFYQSSVGGSPEHIGYYKEVTFPQGYQFDVYRSSDKTLVASITNKVAKGGASSIKTFFDNANYEYNAQFDQSFISQAIQYLIWFGYL